MKRHLIFVIAIFLFFTNCKHVQSNRNDGNITKKERVMDTLTNELKHKVTVKNNNVEILLDSAITVKNDTLYIIYKVINNTPKNLLFFHISALDIKVFLEDSNFPKCSILIIDRNNNLPQSFTAISGPPKKENPDYLPYSHILLSAGENKISHKNIYIGNFHLLGNSFEIKLRYTSPYNEDFINKFKRMQSKKPKLKDYERFEGVIESNQCTLTLP